MSGAERRAPSAVLIGTMSVVALTVAILAAAHAQTWQVIVSAVLINSYISLAYGALPALVIREVEVGETGVATSVSAIARTVGAALAAAIVAVLLGRNPHGYPPESSYTATFVMGAVTALVGMALIVASRPRLRAVETNELADSRAMNHEWG